MFLIQFFCYIIIIIIKKMLNVIDNTFEMLKSRDLFGHKLNFNYQRKGSSYKSCLGGCTSVGIEIFILMVFIVRLGQLYLLANPDISLNIQ